MVVVSVRDCYYIQSSDTISSHSGTSDSNRDV